ALLHRGQSGPDDDRPDVQCDRRCDAGSGIDQPARAATVGLAEWNQTLAGRLPQRFIREMSCRALTNE
ncbi:hypothetical protein NJB1728f10_00010, partial [Mycobacterium marinum]